MAGFAKKCDACGVVMKVGDFKYLPSGKRDSICKPCRANGASAGEAAPPPEIMKAEYWKGTKK